MYKKVLRVVIVTITLLAVGLPQAVKAVSPKPLTTSGYSHGMLNNFRIDAADPAWVDGNFINQFLEYYPNSKLRGHGATIKRLADKWGVNTVAYLGQIAKETTFGSADCGGPYNFGCYMWAPWMNVGKVGPSTGHTNYDRDWANPPTVERGIEIQMQLVRENYINKGYVYYPMYLERYSPSFENDHSSFGSLMWGVMKSFGQDPNETRVKVPGGYVDLEVAKEHQNIDSIKPMEITIRRGAKLDKEELSQYITDDNVESLELMEEVDTSKEGKVETRLFMVFKDLTFTEIKAIFTIEPKDVKTKVYNVKVNEFIDVTGKEGSKVKVDITKIYNSGKEYQLSSNARSLIEYQGKLKSKAPYMVKDKVKVTEELGKYYIEIDKLDNKMYYLLEDTSETVVDIVEKWLGRDDNHERAN